MMDSITDLNSVLSALETYKNAVVKLNETINNGDANLMSNKTQIQNAWVSDNSSLFLAQYENLITYVNEAYKSLESYQGKIQNVVSQFQGFDSTIENS